MPRRMLWGTVAVVVALLLVGGLLPHSTSAPAPVAHGTVRAADPSLAWLAPPSWPWFALRHARSAVRPVSFAPSWPWFAVRGVGLGRPTSARPVVTPVVVPPATTAAPLALARRVALGGTVAWLVLGAVLVALLVFVGRALAPRLVALRRRRHGLDAALRVLTLAERGVEQRRIARAAGLPRDAVRAMLHAPDHRR
jgi:hypothetical protein